MADRNQWIQLLSPAAVTFGVTATVIQLADFSGYFDTYSNLNKALLSIVAFLFILCALQAWNLTKYFNESSEFKRNYELEINNLKEEVKSESISSKTHLKVSAVSAGEGTHSNRVVVTIGNAEHIETGQVLLLRRNIIAAGAMNDLGLLIVISRIGKSADCVVFKPFGENIESLESKISNQSFWPQMAIFPTIKNTHIQEILAV